MACDLFHSFVQFRSWMRPSTLKYRHGRISRNILFNCTHLLDTRAISYCFEDWKHGSRKQLFKYLPSFYFTKEVNSSLDVSPLINDCCLVKRAPTFSVNQAVDWMKIDDWSKYIGWTVLCCLLAALITLNYTCVYDVIVSLWLCKIPFPPPCLQWRLNIQPQRRNICVLCDTYFFRPSLELNAGIVLMCN